jgi:hypothetical protein
VFSTVVCQFDKSKMLVTDLSRKVIHTSTVIQELYKISSRQRSDLRSYREDCAKMIVGQMVNY